MVTVFLYVLTDFELKQIDFMLWHTGEAERCTRRSWMLLWRQPLGKCAVLRTA
jgi:hypothetical protein